MSKGPPESNPPADLMRERDEVLQSFSRGAKFTEEFTLEYKKVCALLEELEAENELLRAQLAADDSLARLVSQVERLESERNELLQRTQRAEKAQGSFDERFLEAEEQFSSLANVFVASNQLHARLAPRVVVRRIKEILSQLVGAEAYTLYMLEADSHTLVPLATEGVPGARQNSISVRGTLIGDVFESGKTYVDQERPSNITSFDGPVAVIPLRVEEQSVAVVAIFGTLKQKESFSSMDLELFRLLEQHAAKALVAAALFEESGARLPSLASFRDLNVS